MGNDCDEFEGEKTATPTVLFDMAEVCAAQGDATKGVRMMILGQMRGLVDLSLFTPNSDEDEKKAAELYGRLYYQMGGSGPEQAIVEPEQFIRLIESISFWEPLGLLDYEPEWQYESAPSHERYLLEVEKTKVFRINQLLRYRQHLKENTGKPKKNVDDADDT